MRNPNIVNMEYGSRLYRLATPASDTDYAGIFMPTMQELLLQKGKQSHDFTTGDNDSKNSAEDVDNKIFSLHTFLGLCLSGDTTALDMLHCDEPISTSWIFEELRDKRKMFYTRKMKAYVGYVRSQALKYGMKGDKLVELKSVITALEECVDTGLNDAKIGSDEVWYSLPVGEYINKVYEKRVDGDRYYEILGKKYQDTNSVEYVLKAAQKRWDSYGHRAKQAMTNDGMDWKAIHHSLRVMYQVRAICEYGDFHYPLAETDFLMRVKCGDVNYLEEVAPEFDKFFDNIDLMLEKSGLPDKTDVKYWENWLVGVYDQHFNIEYKE